MCRLLTPAWGVDVEGTGLDALINAKGGFLVNGAAGATGTCLGVGSDGYYDTPITCLSSAPTPPTVYYQTIHAVESTFTQRPVLNFNSTLFTVTDSASPAETQVAIKATGNDPEVVTASTGGTSGDCPTWDASGNLTSGVVCPSLTAIDDYFTVNASCTISSGSNLDNCDGTISFTSGGNTTPAVPAMADTNYWAICQPLNTASPASGDAITINGKTTTTLAYTLIEIMSLGQSGGYTINFDCHLHHN